MSKQNSTGTNLKCHKCKGQYQLEKAVKESEAMGNNDICCPYCNDKIGSLKIRN